MEYINNRDITNVKCGIIAHGVNRQLVMGSGVAKSIKTQWPKVYQQFMSMSNPVPALGEVDEVIVDENFLSIMNCYTQNYYGRDGKVYADYDAVITSLKHVATLAEMYGFNEIHIPRIGCGYGGLDWIYLETELWKIEREWEREFIVYTL